MSDHDDAVRDEATPSGDGGGGDGADAERLTSAFSRRLHAKRSASRSRGANGAGEQHHHHALDHLLSAVTLSFHDVSFGVKVGPPWRRSYKPILRGVSGRAQPGRLLAIMGASGAGKTSLLNLLAGRASGVGTGSVRINGDRFSTSQLRALSGYVMQDDLLSAELTVRESLMFVARLRLPSSVTRAERAELVDAVLEELGIGHIAGTKVGDSTGQQSKKRGVSGGERKRLAIGAELITDPAILFLDEPTSGLDSTTALAVVQTLRMLARSGRTVIATIHQPRSGIFELFDDLLLLADGRVAYAGPCDRAVAYFAKLGHECPQYTNPADYFLDITSVDRRGAEVERTSTARRDAIVAAYDESAAATTARTLPTINADAATVDAAAAAAHKARASWLRQFIALSLRFLLNTYRDKARTIFRLVQTIFISFIIALLFFQLGNDQTSIQDKSGVLFFILLNNSFSGMFSLLNSFSSERPIFLRETAQGYYGTSSYFVAKALVELPLSLIPIIFGVIVYYIVGLSPGLDRFAWFLLVLYVTTFTTESLGLCLGAVSPNTDVALGLSPLVLIIFLLFSGFYINSESIPPWMVWIEYISFIPYAYENLVVNEFRGATITCSDDQLVSLGVGAAAPGDVGATPSGTFGATPAAAAAGAAAATNGTLDELRICPLTKGDDVINRFSMTEDDFALNFIVLVVMIAIYRLLAYLALRFCYRGGRVVSLGQNELPDGVRAPAIAGAAAGAATDGGGGGAAAKGKKKTAAKKKASDDGAAGAAAADGEANGDARGAVDVPLIDVAAATGDGGGGGDADADDDDNDDGDDDKAAAAPAKSPRRRKKKTPRAPTAPDEEELAAAAAAAA
eukprot:CAMPEP_0198309828 /NCGR_PEP_ID=MMETSP1450-20131203/2080_1 /TAXON_ID=753684 ORGANISM="Madagascaria erythrocladiodes, Strain CCMP3234" /NCGR_SAMPLE_ID=MMETSP1450 /ASSEMBLY_ACC=CAM_ASM_001115 /LENGTH=853 /DNA_ID=CAMNT_0044012607 /DNA_START=34 /DNA_END=2591 /DNA_ORIENTATION=+